MKIELKRETKHKVKYNSSDKPYTYEETQYWCTVDDRYVEGSLTFTEEDANVMYELVKNTNAVNLTETIKSETI